MEKVDRDRAPKFKRGVGVKIILTENGKIRKKKGRAKGLSLQREATVNEVHISATRGDSEWSPHMKIFDSGAKGQPPPAHCGAGGVVACGEGPTSDI